MANFTPEPQNAPELKPLPEPVCGWCISSHVANIKCKCEAPCGVGWCAASVEDPFAVSFP